VPVKIRYGMSTILDGYICDYPLMEGGEKLCQWCGKFRNFNSWTIEI